MRERPGNHRGSRSGGPTVQPAGVLEQYSLLLGHEWCVEVDSSHQWTARLHAYYSKHSTDQLSGCWGLGVLEWNHRRKRHRLGHQWDSFFGELEWIRTGSAV